MNRRKSAFIAIILVLCIALGWRLFGPRPLVYPLLPLADVDSISAHKSDESGDFQVPAKFWSDLYDALQPARQDDSPAKWAYLGSISIKSKLRGFMQVFLYQVDEGAGAFAIQNGKDSVYYRGGDSAKLMEVLQSAYSAAH